MAGHSLEVQIQYFIVDTSNKYKETLFSVQKYHKQKFLYESTCAKTYCVCQA